MLTLAAITAAGATVAMKTEASAAEAAAIPPVMSCEALAKSDFTALDARITRPRQRRATVIPFCDVKGYISPVTQFEALLPTETWRGDYLQQGCGGLCGKVDVSFEDPSRTSGYQAPYAPLQNGEMVVAADDEGHETAEQRRRAVGEGTTSDCGWCSGTRSEHQLARAVKALIRTFYGRESELFLLQRRLRRRARGPRPGAALSRGFRRNHRRRPANNWAPLAGLFEPWAAAMNRNAEGRQILTAEKLPALHAAVMAACADTNGVIEDPRACAFDPASLRCPEGADQPNCLTDEQVRVVRDEYRGPTTRTVTACSTAESHTVPSWLGRLAGHARR